MSSIKQSFTQWLGIEHKVPVMLENKAGKYITYGAFNEYPAICWTTTAEAASTMPSSTGR